MHAQNCLFLALKCSNRAQSDLDKHMEALFFISSAGLADKSPFAAQCQLWHPHWPEAWDARRRGWHHYYLLLAQELLVQEDGQAAPGQPCWTHLLCWLPPTGSVQTKPRCTIKAHNVAVEVAQHFEKIIVKSDRHCRDRLQVLLVKQISLCRTNLQQTS